MAETFSFDYFGSPVYAEALGTGWVPAIQHTLSSHCVPFTSDGKIVAVHIIGRGVDIPGGHLDDDETAIQAMQREAREEARITVSDPILIDVWRLSSPDEKFGLTEKPYLLLYSATVESMDEFQINDEVDNRYVLEPDEFVNNYFGDKNQARLMVDKALVARS